jgi:1,4-dihydroxy-6-naphthoate synthase
MNADPRPVLRLGHSPDPDDAFMWWPLFEIDGRPPRIDTGRFRFTGLTADIETLNQQSASSGQRAAASSRRSVSSGQQFAPGPPLEITAISCAHYPYVQDRYAITTCGASMGEKYGPKLVGRGIGSLDDLREMIRRGGAMVAVPGRRTSAFAAFMMLCRDHGMPDVSYEVVPFDEIIHRVATGDFAAGLVIHEGQLTYAESGLMLLADLGEWWWERERLPMPLGLNVVRRDLEEAHGEGTLVEIASILSRSIDHALAHRDDSLDYALQFARGLRRKLADAFIAMYVNEWTVDVGETGQKAVRRFLERAHEAGIVPPPDVEFIPAAASGVR